MMHKSEGDSLLIDRFRFLIVLVLGLQWFIAVLGAKATIRFVLSRYFCLFMEWWKLRWLWTSVVPVYTYLLCGCLFSNRNQFSVFTTSFLHVFILHAYTVGKDAYAFMVNSCILRPLAYFSHRWIDTDTFWTNFPIKPWIRYLK